MVMKTRAASKWIIEIIAALFVLLFIYTAIDKVSGQKNFEITISKSPLIGPYAKKISYLLPALEILVAIALSIPKTKLAGLWGAFILMSTFTIYIAYMILFTPRLPCSCGGVLKYLTWKEHLIFNILFTLAAFTGIILFVVANRKRVLSSIKT
jgi:uncharacterized integral membrane protein